MLNNQEKKEMLEDGRSLARRENFKFAREKGSNFFSFDEYLIFLSNIQRLFAQFKISHRLTNTKFNKL